MQYADNADESSQRSAAHGFLVCGRIFIGKIQNPLAKWFCSWYNKPNKRINADHCVQSKCALSFLQTAKTGIRKSRCDSAATAIAVFSVREHRISRNADRSVIRKTSLGQAGRLCSYMAEQIASLPGSLWQEYGSIGAQYPWEGTFLLSFCIVTYLKGTMKHEISNEKNPCAFDGADPAFGNHRL